MRKYIGPDSHFAQPFRGLHKVLELYFEDEDWQRDSAIREQEPLAILTSSIWLIRAALCSLGSLRLNADNGYETCCPSVLLYN